MAFRYPLAGLQELVEEMTVLGEGIAEVNIDISTAFQVSCTQQTGIIAVCERLERIIALMEAK